jgi:flavin-dependent dehydrogenase
LSVPRTIRILGAGPSGLTAAINLVRAGFPVEVYERKPDCGLRFTGDLQGLENWSTEHDVLDEIRSYGVEPDFLATPSRTIDMVGGRETTRIELPNNGWYLVERGTSPHSVDQRLRAQAEAAGVVIHFDATLPEAEADIIATGPRKRDLVAVGKGIVFDTDAPDTSVMLLGHSVARTGYTYLLIANGRGVLCCGIFESFDRIHDCFEESKRLIEARYTFNIRSPRQFGGVEGFSLQPRFQMGNQLLVGEAAGVQDLLWGFGIRTAIRSGYVAARSIIENRSYDELANELIVPGLKASAVGRWLWELGRIRNYEWTLRLLRAQRDQVRFIRMVYSWTPLHRLLYPLAAASLARRYGHFKPNSE